MPKPTPNYENKAKVEKIEVDFSSTPIRTELIEFTPITQSSQTRIDEAEVIIAGGKGLKNAQNFKMLEELAGDVLVDLVVARELEGDLHHVEREHGHPAGRVALLERAAAGQAGAAVEHADVVEPEKATREQVLAARILAVHPPREIQ